MASFRGTFDYTLDAKNRLTVPARFRAVLADGVVMAKSTEPCVQLWVPADYESVTSSALSSLNPLSPDARKLRRFFSANSHDTELDSAGRIGFPPFLLEHASLDKDVVVTGAARLPRGLGPRRLERLQRRARRRGGRDHGPPDRLTPCSWR